MAMQERLKQFRNTSGLTQRQVAVKIGVTASRYGNYEAGVSSPPAEILELLHKNLDVSISWLIAGTEPMFSPREEKTKTAVKPSLGYLEEVLASKEELEELRSVAEAKAGKVELKTENEKLRLELEQKNEKLRRELQSTQEQLNELKSIVHREHNIPDAQELAEPKVPYLTDVAAGPLRETLPQGDYKIPGDKRHLLQGRFSDYFAAKVRGESMSDCIPDGSVVLMRECFVPKEGRVYLFRIDSEFSLKEFGIDAEKELPYLAYCDGSGRRVYPVAEQTCYCVAEFVAVLEKKIN